MIKTVIRYIDDNVLELEDIDWIDYDELFYVACGLDGVIHKIPIVSILEVLEYGNTKVIDSSDILEEISIEGEERFGIYL